MAHALVLLHEYSIALTEVAAATLGNDRTGNRDIQFLMTIYLEGASSPTQLADVAAAGRNTAGRSLGRLESAGWISRTTDPFDGRGVLIRPTPKGKRTVRSFMSRVSDLFVSRQPLVKEVLHQIGGNPDRTNLEDVCDPFMVMVALTRVGAKYEIDVIEALRRFGPHDASDRFTLALLYVRGTQRPGQLAGELHFTPSGMSGVLTRLEDAGLISRVNEQGADDHRAVNVTLTASGRAAAEAMVAVCRQHAHALAAALALTLNATRS